MKYAVNMKYFCVLLLSFTVSIHADIAPVDFDISMGKGTKHYDACLKAKTGPYTLATKPKPAIELFNLFRQLYEKNNVSKVACHEKVKIPHVMHSVWIGGQFPSKFQKYRDSWIEKHPTWAHIFWTDNPINYDQGLMVEHIDTLVDDLHNGVYAGKLMVINVSKLKLFNQKLYDRVSNLGEKSDILKYELVYKFGGVYIDCDFECIQPIDILHRCYDFYVGIQPLDESLALGAALFGATVGHRILKECIETMERDQKHTVITHRTGPIHFTRAFFTQAAIEQNDINIAWPASFFYPVAFYQKNISTQSKKELIRPETFAIHHWAGTWVGK